MLSKNLILHMNSFLLLSQKVLGIEWNQPNLSLYNDCHKFYGIFLFSKVVEAERMQINLHLCLPGSNEGDTR